MKKIFRMANAELNKIFLRPSMFVLATVLILTLVVSFFNFNASSSSNVKYTYDGITASQIYIEQFEPDRKLIKQNLVDAKDIVSLYLISENDSDNPQINDKLQEIKKLFNEAFEYQNKTGQFYVLYDTVINLENTYKPTPSDLENLTRELSYFRGQLSSGNYDDGKQGIIEMLNSIQTESANINFFIKTDELKSLTNIIKNLNDNLPTTEQLKDYTVNDIVSRFNILLESYDINSLNSRVQKLKHININPTEIKNLLDKYYYSNIEENIFDANDPYIEVGTLKTLYEDIKTYYYENSTSTDKEVLANLNEKIAKYYDYIQINKTLIENKFELLKIGSKTDDEIVSYHGFSGTSVYNLKKEITIGEYFLKNNTFGYEYLDAFNFNVSSGTVANVYDFTFYAMQILSGLIILFTIFFACSIITGEQNSGVLKMVATRPFTRNKIYSGKFLACFNVALILMVISFVASFVVGIACFGFTTQNVLVVANASTIFVTNPLVVMLLQFISLLIDIVFYLALAFLISMIIKPTTISTAITSSIYLISTLISGFVNASWIRFIPSLNLGLYKFFTESNVGVFSYSIVPSLNLVQSLIIVIGSIFIFDVLARIIFKSKSIDK